MAKLKTLRGRLAPPPSRLAVMAGGWRSDTMTSTQRGYDHRWQKVRAAYLYGSPLCVYCEREGRVTAATVVDHVEPHRGDQALFWNRANWQSLCRPCHDVMKKREEAQGVYGASA